MNPDLATRILSASVSFRRHFLREALHLSTGTIKDAVAAEVDVEVEVRGRRATGSGCIFLSDLWAWPSLDWSHAEREHVLQDLCRSIAEHIWELAGAEPHHPLELGLRLARSVRDWPCAPSPPPLARNLCASPFDAAIHDAVGRAVARSAFQFFDGDDPIPSADSSFPAGGTSQAIRETILAVPKRTMHSWFVLGPRDPLNATLADQLRIRGDHFFKLKLLTGDPRSSSEWLGEAWNWLLTHSTHPEGMCVDANEAFSECDSVIEMLDRLRRDSPRAFAALQYLEQPTGRDLERFSLDWRAHRLEKPIFIDEAMVDMASLQAAQEQGWHGVGLKTCKGHSFCLVAAAWARQRNMPITVQDLTNPGLALVHGALMAAHLPTHHGVELNSPQFTPDANREWEGRFPALFRPSHGVHQLPSHVPIGLGSVWRTEKA